MITALVVLAFAFALLPALMYLRNLREFRPPPAIDTAVSLPSVSVLIPARNEAAAIARCVESVLLSQHVELEVIVLDDHSTDRTAEVVRELAAKNPRVRLESAPPLPEGWCGKQHACFVLSKLARHDVLIFLDADVRLTPDAIARMASFLSASKAGLVSGFPRQETGTLLEKLVIPLINWLLMCYLPMSRMRIDPSVSLGTGCGQWFATTRTAYEKVGGHAAVKSSLHDGIKLPRAYRAAGLMTDICDATELATCRMYRSAGQVWFGLAKNAREGLGAPGAIAVWTALLVAGHVLPFAMLSLLAWMETWQIALAAIAIGLSLGPRFHASVRFRQSFVGAAFHPFGVLVLLAIQWYATVRHWFGNPVGWKGRAYPSLSSNEPAPDLK